MSVLPVMFPAASTSASVSNDPTWASTYALILCWVASFVAELEDILSSSLMPVTVAPSPATDRFWIVLTLDASNEAVSAPALERLTMFGPPR